MSRSRYQNHTNSALHFYPLSNWIPAFTRPGTVQVILDAFVWWQQTRTDAL